MSNLGAAALENPRDKTQANVFTRWINLHLTKAREPFQVKDIGIDLVSGEGLIYLSEVFVPGPVTKFTKPPKNQLQRTQNHSQALTRFEGDNCPLINIHASTLANEEANNTKVFMGYIFQLILKYSVGNINDELDADAQKKQQSLAQLKQSLIDWVNAKLAGLSEEQNAQVRKFNNAGDSQDVLKVTNLESDWTDGTILAGLAIALHPADKRQYGFDKLDELVAGGQSPLAATISRSSTNLSVPALMEAEEMSSSPDQNSILTYVSAFKNAKYVDDEPVVENGELVWDEPTFLQIEVQALESRDLTQLVEQKEILSSKLDQFKADKQDGKVFEDSDNRKAARMEFHLRRVVATIQNAADDQAASSGKADETAATIAQKDDEIASANQQLDDEKKKAKKLQDDLDAANQELDDEKKKAKKLQDDLDAANQEVEEQKKKAKKLQDDLDAANALADKLTKRQSRLGELQAALLACAAISDEMMNDEMQ